MALASWSICSQLREEPEEAGASELGLDVWVGFRRGRVRYPVYKDPNLPRTSRQ